MVQRVYLIDWLNYLQKDGLLNRSWQYLIFGWVLKKVQINYSQKHRVLLWWDLPYGFYTLKCFVKLDGWFCTFWAEKPSEGSECNELLFGRWEHWQGLPELLSSLPFVINRDLRVMKKYFASPSCLCHDCFFTATYSNLEQNLVPCQRQG